MQDAEDALFTLGTLPKRIRWLIEEAPTDLEPAWEYGLCTTQSCEALARFLKPWSRLDRARRVEPVELCARVRAADEELRNWERRVGSGFSGNRAKRAKRRNAAVSAAFAAAASQMDAYLQCRPALTPRQWVEQARDLVERLYVFRPRDAEYQHGISFAVSGLEQALGQLPE